MPLEVSRVDEVATVQGRTSGTALIDGLLDGVHIGDNLVFQGDADAPLDLIVDRFIEAWHGRLPVVVVTVERPWEGPVPDGLTVLDWSPVSTGEPSHQRYTLAADATLDDALTQLRNVDAEVGAGAAFVFDRLAAVQRAWNADAALDLFLAACPRLYRRRSLALWPVDAAHHRPSFLRRLAEITQVVVELDSEGDEVTCTVRKADGRAAEVVGRTLRAEVRDGDLRSIDTPTTSRERLGTRIRDQRLSRGVSQAELARQVGISASALSQVERGVRGPSGDTLMRLWEVLGVAFGPTDDRQPGYQISRRSGRDRTPLQDGLIGERLLDDPDIGQLWLLEFAPGATGDRAPFAVKVAETATVLHGILDLKVGGHTETLHEGDALVAAELPIMRWANPGDTPAEAIWMLQPTGPTRR